MARRLVSDDQKMFRVVVIERERRDNPTWERGNVASARFLWDGPEYTISYGPYNTPGAARGQLTFHTVDAYGKPREGVVSGHIEEAHTTWVRVGEQPPATEATAQAYRQAADALASTGPSWGGPDHADGWTAAAEYLRRRATELETREQPPAEVRSHCAHGYVLAQGTCPNCDAAEERPHKADPVTVRPEGAKRDRRLCRECGLSPAHKIHRTG
ncbi:MULTISPECIES: hypothetical protein [unclassified Streptomyces]|uniref:hypothetical protein n=1 Tax=unclassified Streptomyces TaxID=2593676 RepID=UPI0035D7BD1D